MSGLLVVVCVWLVCGGIKGGVERYLEGRGKRVSGGQRRLLTILCVLATLAAAVMEAGNILLQPPQIIPVNYEEVFTAPLEIEMQIHGILGLTELPFAEIYYTTDGSDPADAAVRVKYEGPFVITSSTSFTARSLFFGLFWSELEVPSAYYKMASADGTYVAAEGLEIRGGTALSVGEQGVLEAVIAPENATDTAVYWTSSDPEAVAVDRQTGRITALEPGKQVYITARTVVGTLSASVTVRTREAAAVSTPPPAPAPTPTPTPTPTLTVERLPVEPSWVLLEEGESCWLEAWAEPAGAAGELVWHSETAWVASVTADGYVTGRQPGTAQICVTAPNGVTACGTVEVLPPVPAFVPVDSVNVQAEEPVVLLEGGDGVQLDAWVLPTDATEQRLRWSSEDPSVVEVTGDGALFPGEPGQTTVWVEDWDGRCAVPIEVVVVGIPEEVPASVEVQTDWITLFPDGGVMVDMDISSPEGHSELYLEYAREEDGAAWITEPLTCYEDRCESWFSTTISAGRYGLEPGVYEFRALLCRVGEDGALKVLAEDTFWVEVAA